MNRARTSERRGDSALEAFLRLPPDTLIQVLQTGRKQWKRYCSELKCCQREFNPKAVHSFRIAARRLLSFSELLGGFSNKDHTKRIRELLKKQLDVFDELRDSQVQRGLLKGWTKRFEAAADFRKHLAKREKRLVRSTRQDLKAARTKKVSKLLRAARKNAEAFLATAKGQMGKAILLRTISDAFAGTVTLRECIVGAQPDTIHRTRVAFKKFRYMVEALACFVTVDESFLERLQAYQTLMGDAQDRVVLHKAFIKYSSKRKPQKEETRLFDGELKRSTAKAIRRYLAEADDLYKFWLAPDCFPRKTARVNGKVSANGLGNSLKGRPRIARGAN